MKKIFRVSFPFGGGASYFFSFLTRFKRIFLDLEKSVLEIKTNKINKLKEVNEKDLYDAIESESPFK